MKKCPFCWEKIQKTAIKCRFCHEYLLEDLDTNNKEKTITSNKYYIRAWIISLILYFIAFWNSNISHIWDKLREWEIIWVLTTETQFLIWFLFIIAWFFISKNKIIRLILWIMFGLSIIYSIWVSLNNEQKEIDKRMAIVFSTTECQKSFWDNSHWDWTAKVEWGYNCYCNKWYIRNNENTKCITISESCNILYPGSIADWTKNENWWYNCDCPKNLWWNSKGTKCITPTQFCKERYGKNAYSNWRFDENKITICYY